MPVYAAHRDGVDQRSLETKNMTDPTAEQITQSMMLGGFGVLIRQISERESLHRNKIQDGRQATWRLVGTAAQILYVCFPGSSETAYQWPDKPMPFAPPGMVSFGDESPDIQEARPRLKQHEELWDAVRRDHWDSLKVFGPIAAKQVYAR